MTEHQVRRAVFSQLPQAGTGTPLTTRPIPLSMLLPMMRLDPHTHQPQAIMAHQLLADTSPTTRPRTILSDTQRPVRTQSIPRPSTGHKDMRLPLRQDPMIQVSMVTPRHIQHRRIGRPFQRDRRCRCQVDRDLSGIRSIQIVSS